MEVSAVRLNKIIIVILLSVILPAYPNEQSISYDELSEYYGFGEMEIIKLDWGVSNLRIADFNGDGRNDIVVTNNRKARIELLLQKESIGPGEEPATVDPNDIDINTITPPTRFEKHNIPISQKIQSMVCGDLNSDGLEDMAFYGEPRGLYIMLQKAKEGEAEKTLFPEWQTQKKIKLDDGLLNPNMLACADMNNDGLKDLIVAGNDGIYIIVQKDSGLLAEPVKYPTSVLSMGVDAGDLNGDNINDLIIVTTDAEKPIHVRYGLETGQLGPQVQLFIERPYVLELVDIDDEPGKEILTIDALSGRMICYKLSPDNRKDVDWPILFYPLASGQGDTKRDLAAGDFNGDGLIDIVVSNPGAAELVLYKQTPQIGLTEPVKFPAFSDITSLSAADIDHDGQMELGILSVKEKVIGISKYEDERLSFPRPVGLTGEPVAMELSDIDNDGSMDCVYVSKDQNDNRTFRIIQDLYTTEKQHDNPAGIDAKNQNADQNSTDPVLELSKLTSNPEGMKVLDVDQDGMKDVLIFVSYELPILVRQTQQGKFEVVDSPKAQTSLIKEASERSTAVANIDGKPGDELLVAQKNFARSLIFSEGQSWNVVDQYNSKSTENQIAAVAAFDILSTDRPTILLLDGQKGQLQVLNAGEDKTYRVEKELDVGKWSTTARLKMMYAPLTGGREKNILLFDSEKFALITPPSSEETSAYLEQQFSYETEIKDGVYGNLTAGDINSDNRLDIITVEPKNNYFEILALDAGLKPVPAMRFKIFEQKSYRDSENRGKTNVEPREMKIADVTGDGKDDLVTIIHDRIIVYPQD